MTIFPQHMAVSPNGNIILAYNDTIIMLNSSFEVITTQHLFGERPHVFAVYASDHDSFWITYNALLFGSEYYLIEMDANGQLLQPTLLARWDSLNCDPCQGFSFVSPDGETCNYVTDMYGYLYSTSLEEPGARLYKYTNPESEPIYVHYLSSNHHYEEFEEYSVSPNYYITYSGDFYTLHATEDGLVLTKYTYQCN